MPEKLTIGCIWIAGLVECGEEALKRAPTLAAKMPDFMTNELWGFIPIALLTVGVAAWTINKFRAHSSCQTTPIENKTDFPSLQFFPSRANLASHRQLDDQLSKATTINASLMVGRSLQKQKLTNLHHIKKVLLPNPRSASTEHYAKTIDDTEHFAQYIIETTRYLKNNNIDVKWYPHLICNSILIGDPQSTSSGWVHLENNLPYSKSNLRHSITIYKKDHDQLVSSITDVFDHMWAEALAPTDEQLTALEPIDKIIAYVARRISDEENYSPRARLEIRQKAIQGLLQIYGHPSEQTPINSTGTSWNLARVSVPTAYWIHADINVMATAPTPTNGFTGHTQPTKSSNEIYIGNIEERYANLSASWGEVIKLWP